MRGGPGGGSDIPGAGPDSLAVRNECLAPLANVHKEGLAEHLGVFIVGDVDVPGADLSIEVLVDDP